jgi:hypothetical protein
MAHPEPIGLDLTTLDFEMAFSHLTGGNVYNPELLEMEVRGYRTAIRVITEFAFRNSDTPDSDDEFRAFTDPAGTAEDPEKVAYVTTGEVGTAEDALLRTDGDLDFGRGGSGDGGGSTVVETATTDLTIEQGTTETTFDVEKGLHSMGAHLHASQAIADLELVDPRGEVVSDFEAVTEERVGGKCCGLPEFVVSEPEAGTWTLRVDNRRETAQAAELQTWTMAAEAPNPDPVESFGYEQRSYDVTPFRFFEDYDEFTIEGGTVEPITVKEVANGALGDYDHAIVIHDYGANGGPGEEPGDSDRFGYTEADHPDSGFTKEAYLDALDEFVDAGGNLVLTDAGTKLLRKLDNSIVDGSKVDEGDILTGEYPVAQLLDKNLDHPLFGTDDDVRPIQEQLWKVAPLGYEAFNGAPGQAPMFAVDETALAAAAGDGSVATVAGTNNEGVAAASVTPDDTTGDGIHVIGSLLPPATQKNVHAFGLMDYTVTFMGYVLLTSALGWEQVRRPGDEERRYGIGNEWNTEGVTPIDPPAPDFTAEGYREDDGSVFTGGQTNRVKITVSSIGGDVAADAEVTITDGVPDGWTVDESYADVQSFDGDEGVVRLDPVTPSDVEGDATETRAYFAEAPEGPGETGQSTFGPAEAVATIDGETVTAQVAGTKDVLLVGPSTEA